MNRIRRYNQIRANNNRPKVLKKPYKQKVTLFEYLAVNVPSDSHILINKYDYYPRAKNPTQLTEQLKHFTRTFGEKGLNLLAEIHPDRKLIENINKSKFSNIDGVENEELTKVNIPLYRPKPDESEDKIRKQDIELSKLIIIGGIILVGISIIMKNK